MRNIRSSCRRGDNVDFAMFPSSKRIKLTKSCSASHACGDFALAGTMQNQDQDEDPDPGQSSTSSSSKMTLSPAAESPEPYDTKSEGSNRPAMSLSNPGAARVARQKAINEKMPDILAVSRRLHSALDISDSVSRQNSLMPFTFPQIRVGPVLMNGVRLRASLRMCTNFAVDMNRKSENHDFLDRRILSESSTTTDPAIVSNTRMTGVHDQGLNHGIKDNSDTVMTNMKNKVSIFDLAAAPEHGSPNDSEKAHRSINDPQAVLQIDPVGPGCGEANEVSNKFASNASSQLSAASSNTTVTAAIVIKHPEIQALSSSSAKSAAKISSPAEKTVATGAVKSTDLEKPIMSAVTATTVSVENESTAQVDKENPRPGKIWPQFSVPDPMKMPGTFTSAICHQQDFNVAPLLTLTLREITPVVECSATQRSQILLHFEVGLDNVEALCQGTFTIDDSSYWQENLQKHQSLRKQANAKANIQAQSKEVEQYQIRKGHGQGCWVFFGVRFRQTGKDKRKGKGGKWACFGVPLQSCSPVASNTEVATYGGGCDGEGISVPQYLAKVRRLESRVSTGGIACIDLWQNADEWGSGVWSKVKQAMAKNSLIVSSLRATEEIVTAQMRRAGMTEANGPNASKYEKQS